MDRGFTFKLISNYINMITATDSKVSAEHAGGPAQAAFSAKTEVGQTQAG